MRKSIYVVLCLALAFGLISPSVFSWKNFFLSPLSFFSGMEKYGVYLAEPPLRKLMVLNPESTTSRNKFSTLLKEHQTLHLFYGALSDKGRLNFLSNILWNSYPKYAGKNVWLVLKWNNEKNCHEVKSVFTANGEKIYPFTENLIYSDPVIENGKFIQGKLLDAVHDPRALGTKINKLIQAGHSSFFIQNFSLDSEGGFQLFAERLWSKLQNYGAAQVGVRVEADKQTHKPQVTAVYDAKGRKIYPHFALYTEAQLREGRREKGVFYRGYMTRELLKKDLNKLLKKHNFVIVENFLLEKSGGFNAYDSYLWYGWKKYERGWVNPHEIKKIYPDTNLKQLSEIFDFDKKDEHKWKFQEFVDEDWLEKNGFNLLLPFYRQSQCNTVTAVFYWDKKDQKPKVKEIYDQQGEKIYPFKNNILYLDASIKNGLRDGGKREKGFLDLKHLNETLHAYIEDHPSMVVERVKLNSSGGSKFLDIPWEKSIKLSGGFIDAELITSQKLRRDKQIFDLRQSKGGRLKFQKTVSHELLIKHELLDLYEQCHDFYVTLQIARNPFTQKPMVYAMYDQFGKALYTKDGALILSQLLEKGDIKKLVLVFGQAQAKQLLKLFYVICQPVLDSFFQDRTFNQGKPTSFKKLLDSIREIKLFGEEIGYYHLLNWMTYTDIANAKTGNRWHFLVRDLSNKFFSLFKNYFKEPKNVEALKKELSKEEISLLLFDSYQQTLTLWENFQQQQEKIENAI